MRNEHIKLQIYGLKAGENTVPKSKYDISNDKVWQNKMINNMFPRSPWSISGLSGSFQSIPKNDFELACRDMKEVLLKAVRF